MTHSIFKGIFFQPLLTFHLLFLSKSVTTIFGLSIVIWIIIDIVEDNDIGRSQIDSQSTGACCENENFDIGISEIISLI